MFGSSKYPVPESWMKDSGPESVTREEKLRVMEERAKLARDYVDYYLSDASEDLKDVAQMLVYAPKSDLMNRNYWGVGLPERNQLNLSDVDRLAEFVAQIMVDRGWSDQKEEVGAEAENREEVFSEVPSETTRDTSLDAEPKVFGSSEEAYETMQANLEALTHDLEALEPIEDDPYQTLKNFFTTLKKHSVLITVDDGRVIKGLPLTLGDSHLESPEERSGWGDPGRVSSGAITSLERVFTVDVVVKPGFQAEKIISGYHYPIIVKTLNRLFSNQ